MNTDPNRKRTHKVVDNYDEYGRQGVYEGTLEDCYQFVSEQSDSDIIGLYDVIPIQQTV